MAPGPKYVHSFRICLQGQGDLVGRLKASISQIVTLGIAGVDIWLMIGF